MFEIDFCAREGLLACQAALNTTFLRFPMWVITCRRYASVLYFSFFPSDLKDGRLCRGADRQSFSTRRLLAASHTRQCSEIVRLCCDSPADGFYCLNLETSFCQSVTGTMCSSKRRFCKSKASVSPLDLLIQRQKVLSVQSDAPGQRRLTNNSDESQSALVLPLGPYSGLCCHQSAGGEPFVGNHSN